MLESFYLSNFKAFGQEPQHVKVKPITLIFGPNSSGKSSIIHSLLLLNEVHKQSLKNIEDLNFDIHYTQKGGSSVDLGGFAQYIFKGENRRKFSFTFELKDKQLEDVYALINPEPQKSLFGDSKPLFRSDSIIKIQLTAAAENLDDQDKLTTKSFTTLESIDIQADGLKFIKISRKTASEFAIDWINPSNPIFESIAARYARDENTINNFNQNDHSAFNRLINFIDVEFDSILPSSLSIDFSNITKKDYLLEIRIVEGISELLKAFSIHYKREIQKIEYLGPLRSYPTRSIDSSQDNDPNWISGGGFAWRVVKENNLVRDKINVWLTNEEKIQVPYELDVQFLHTIDAIENDYSEFVESVLGAYFNSEAGLHNEELDAGEVFDELQQFLSTNIRNNEAKYSSHKELIIKDKLTGTKVSHRDIGIGISQVLPVLVNAFGNKNKTIAIEQPEIHLHPKLQSSIIEVFLDSVKENNNRFILETHSEHLIKALQIEVAKYTKSNGKNGISPHDVSILYVSKNGSETEGAYIKEMELDDNGSFINPWPDDFFESSSKLTLERFEKLS